MEMISNYIETPSLRHALNALTRETFGFDFEAWVMNGFLKRITVSFTWAASWKRLNRKSCLTCPSSFSAVKKQALFLVQKRRGKGL